MDNILAVILALLLGMILLALVASVGVVLLIAVTVLWAGFGIVYWSYALYERASGRRTTRTPAP